MKAGLEDLRRELWLRRRNSGELTWTTRDGKEIPVKDMTDEHLANTIRMLERNDEAGRDPTGQAVADEILARREQLYKD